MSKLTKSLKQDLKSASDFEQWLSEINLFAQETQSELHEVAGLLNFALASDHHRELEVGNRLNSNCPLESAPGACGDTAPTSDSEGDDYLASLQHKLTKQLKSKRSPPFPAPAETQMSEPDTKRPTAGDNVDRYGDRNATDPLF